MDAHLTMTDLEAGIVEAGISPRDHGTLEMIVARPGTDLRVVLDQGELHVEDGLVGDDWKMRGSKSTPDGSAHPEAQITLMNSRVIELLSGGRESWPLAGDQLFVDLDLSVDNLPAGQRIAIGSAVLEITAMPHTGCDKFTARFGHDAIRFVNSKEGRAARRRGIYARVVQAGTIRAGDTITKI
jgi:hypothetical protein